MCLPRIARTSALLLVVLTMVILSGCSVTKHQSKDDITIGDEVCSLKNNLKTYLLLGIDKEGSLREEKKPGQGGQSDAIYLLL